MAQWFDKVDKSSFDSFSTVKRSYQTHYQSTLNYFDNRSTNASVESFNAKIKDFRRTFRGLGMLIFCFLGSQKYLLNPSKPRNLS